MKNLIKPHWILLTVTLPQLIMFWLYASSFNIIKSLLSPQTLQYWKSYGLILGSAFLLATCYGIWSVVKKKNINAYYSFIALLFYVPVLYFFLVNSEKIIPRNIPNWMLSSSELPLYVLTFLMPAVFHSLLVLVLFFTPDERKHPTWWNFGIAVAIPFAWYLLFTVAVPLINHGVSHQLLWHVVFLLFASSTVVFFFFLIRGIYIISIKKSGNWKNNYQLLWQVPMFLVFPVLGLYLNNEKFGLIFGNFNSPEFYALAVINGLLLLIPEKLIANYYTRLALFIARSITFSYIIYFFWVFLPVLPFSIVAIIALGTGFLMLTPVLITIIQANTIRHSFIYLSERFSPALLTVCLVAGLATLPAVITYNYSQDRYHLHKALALVYAPDLTSNSSQATDIDPARIKYVLDNVRKNKDRQRNQMSFGFDSKQKPYLSTFYKWLVLDNLTLNNSKIRMLEKVFMGIKPREKADQTQSVRSRRSFLVAPSRSASVVVDSVQVVSKFDKKHQYWRTWVHLDIKNPTGLQQEYATTFGLPAGTWVSNYYLMMEGRKEFGILAEKKAAMWVYQNITSRRRDPGLLHYTEGNQVRFRVFPFAPRQTRKTGIEFVHKEPVQLTIGKRTIVLGNKKQQAPLTQVIKTEGGYYIPATVKQKAVVKELTPYLHFVVDAGRYSVRQQSQYIQRIKNYLKQHPQYQKEAKITFSNFAHRTLALNNESQWEQQLKDYPHQGGFLLGDALTRIYLAAQPKGKYPAIIVVSNHSDNAIFTQSLKGFEPQLLGSKLFYCLQPGHTLSSHSLLESPLQTIKNNVSIPGNKKVKIITVGQNKITIANNEKAAYYPAKLSETSTNNAWANGARLQSLWQAYTLNPDEAHRTFPNHIDIIKGSFQAQIMTPLTSFIAVENDAQKAALKAKQQQVLRGNPLLDAGEEMEQMSEPSLWLLLGLLALVFGIKHWREKRKLRVG